MNLYRGCTHNCIYCDGRSEGYYVDGEFGEDVTVKVNAIEILNRELNPRRKRIPFKRSYMMPGGGVGDSYQPIEEKYQLTRKALQLLYGYNFPVHMLTKSTLILTLTPHHVGDMSHQIPRDILSFAVQTLNRTATIVFSYSPYREYVCVFKKQS